MSETWTKIKQTVDTSVSDREFVKKLEKRIETLAGMVIEAVKENPQYLLSPIMREMLAEKAVEVQILMRKVKGRIVVDNPGENL